MSYRLYEGEARELVEEGEVGAGFGRRQRAIQEMRVELVAARAVAVGDTARVTRVRRQCRATFLDGKIAAANGFMIEQQGANERKLRSARCGEG